MLNVKEEDIDKITDIGGSLLITENDNRWE